MVKETGYVTLDGVLWPADGGSGESGCGELGGKGREIGRRVGSGGEGGAGVDAGGGGASLPHNEYLSLGMEPRGWWRERRRAGGERPRTVEGQMVELAPHPEQPLR